MKKRHMILKRGIIAAMVCAMCITSVPELFVSEVKAEASDAEIEIIAKAMESLTIPEADDIRGNIYLPSEITVGGEDVVSVKWKSSNTDVITDKEVDGKAAGIVNRKGIDKNVTLSATFTYGSKTSEKTIDVVVQAKARKMAKKNSYIFAFFTGTERSTTDEQIYFATSLGGANWKDMTTNGHPSLTSDIGDKGVRDPYLLRSKDGDKFYLIATDLSVHLRGGWTSGNTISTAGSTNLVIWESTDLVNWTDPRLVDMAGSIPNAGCAWAPEVCYDKDTGNYVIYWATKTSQSDNDQNLYYSTTRDFYTFSEPVLWIDRSSHSIIDTTMIYDDESGYYYRASQDGQISIERSKSIYSEEEVWEKEGSLKTIFNNDGYSGNYLEGPEFFEYCEDDWLKDSNGNPVKTWGLMCDQYMSGKGYLPFRSTSLDDMTTNSWSVASDINFGSLKKRHGTILTVTDEEYNAVMEHYGNKGVTIEPLPQEDMVLADFTFNDAQSGITSENAIASGGYHLTNSYNSKYGKAMYLDGSSSSGLNITHTDEGSLLAGINEITISYDAKPNCNSQDSCMLYAAPDGQIPASGNGKYFTVLEADGKTKVKRLNISGTGLEDAAAVTGKDWSHIDIVVSDKSTTIYVNGVKMSCVASGYSLNSILGDTGVLMLGKSPAGCGFKGWLDNLKIRSKALTDEEVLSAYNANPIIATNNVVDPTIPVVTSKPVTTSTPAQNPQSVRPTVAGVTGVKATLKSGSVKLKWAAVAGAAGYIVYKVNGDKKTEVARVMNNYTALKKLKTATAYQYCVQAYVNVNNTVVTGAFSDVVKVLTAPSKPSRVFIKGKTISFKKVVRASKYIIYTYNSKTRKCKKVAVVKGKKNKFSFVIRKAKSKQKYVVKAVAVKKGYITAYSDISRSVTVK